MINENKIRQIYKSNREQGFQLLVECFQEPIYYYIRRLVVLHEDAEDVLQEVFIQVYRHWEQFRCESSLSTWIYRIATNESLRLLNSRKRRETVSTEDIQESLISSLKASDYVDYENELAVKFQEAILRLPEKQRLIFNLRYYDELDYEEIARILDGKADTLKVNYHYAKEKIKEYILNNWDYEKEFDFDDIGKKTPYRVPEGFFDEMQRNVRKHTYGGKPAGHRLWITVSAGIAIAAALVGFLFMPSLFREGDRGGQMLDTGNCTAAAPADKWIREMSDEELEELVSFSESDIFLN